MISRRLFHTSLYLCGRWLYTLRTEKQSQEIDLFAGWISYNGSRVGSSELVTVGFPCQLHKFACRHYSRDTKNSLALCSEDVNLIVGCSKGQQVHGRAVPHMIWINRCLQSFFRQHC